MKPRFPSDADDLLHPESKVKLKDQILLSPITKYVLPTFLLAVCLLAGVYGAMLFLNLNESEKLGTCQILPAYQVNCLPGRSSTYEECTEIGCCWQDAAMGCFHPMPSRHGYIFDESTNYSALLPKEQLSPFGSENKAPIFIDVQRMDEEHVKFNLNTITRASISTPTEIQSVKLSGGILDFLPDIPMENVEVKPDQTSPISVYFQSPEFSITVARGNSTEKIPIMTTSRGPLIITDHYWEWSLFLGNVTLYGLNSIELNGTVNWIYDNGNGNILPAFLAIAGDGMGIGCYIEYDGPMEIEVLESNLIVLRGMSLPDELSINILTGDNPQNVVNKFAEIFHQKSTIVPQFSALGLHICPEVKHDVLSALEKLINSMNAYDAPWDTHCIYKKFHYNLNENLNENDRKTLDDFTKLLNETGRSVQYHISPVCSTGYIPSELMNSSLLLEDSHGIYIGRNGDDNVVYPDWIDNRTAQVYDSILRNYLDTSASSGELYLHDMSPRDDSNYTSDFQKFDYMPQGLQRLMSKGTIPTELISLSHGLHYKVHSAYRKKFNNFVKQYVYSMEVEQWNEADTEGWRELKRIVKRGIASCLLGQLPPAIYACGITMPTSDDLCARWYGIGVVFPYFMAVPQNTSGGEWLNSGTSKYASKLLRLRASLMSYQYSTIMQYYNAGAPILAPMYFHYIEEPLMKRSDDQFMWGSSILVGVVTLPKTLQIHMRIPGKLPWRHLHGGIELKPTDGETMSVSILEGEIVTAIRPGHIIPFHENPGLTSMETRRSPMKLISNLACTDSNCYAEGKIFYEPHSFLHIYMNNTFITFLNSPSIRSQQCIEFFPSINSLEILGDSIHSFDTFSVCSNDTIVCEFRKKPIICSSV